MTAKKQTTRNNATFVSLFILIFFAENESRRKKQNKNKKMIIPIRCFTCNNPWISSRWDMYLKRVKHHRKEEGKPDSEDMEYLTATTTKTAEGKALDDVGIKKVCCRRMMLTHIDLI